MTIILFEVTLSFCCLKNFLGLMQVASESDGSRSTALDTFGNCFALGTLVRHPYQLSILLCLSFFLSVPWPIDCWFEKCTLWTPRDSEPITNDYY